MKSVGPKNFNGLEIGTIINIIWIHLPVKYANLKSFTLVSFSIVFGVSATRKCRFPIGYG